jgi:nucleotide-binding universal stress UspA family protein
VTERLVPISISRILVAFDGSDHSKKATELGITLALKWNAELYLVHVLEETNIPEGFQEFAKIENVNPLDYFDMVNERPLIPAVDRAKAAGVTKVESISLRGNPADEILRTAQGRNVDLIILGSRGLGKFSLAFLGSVCMKVLNHANCTCIAVK